MRSKFKLFIFLSLLITCISALPAFAKHKNSSTSIEDKMSSSGRLAARVRKAMQAKIAVSISISISTAALYFLSC